MKVLSTTAHGILDFVVGLALVLSAFLFGFEMEGSETWSLVLTGTVILIYSILTRYELGIVYAIPMHIHLICDIVLGAFLTLSPWLLGFAETSYMPHLIFGITMIVSGIVTKTEPFTETIVVKHVTSTPRPSAHQHAFE